VGANSLDLGPLPPPPADLASRALPIAQLDRAWYRIHACIHGALFFSTQPIARFNAPNGEYGTTYLGDDLACCFVETFGRLDTAAATTVRTVSQAQLLAACVSEMVSTRPLALVDLTGSGLRRLDADARLFASEHAVARLWGRTLWAHPSQPDGLLFPSRHDPSLPSVALFDRARDAVRAGAPQSLGTLPLAVLDALLDRYDFSLRP
jgi:RES domain